MRQVLIIVLLLSFTTLGCGGAPTAPVVGSLASVSGKVTFKGKPLAGAGVMFNPKTGTKGMGAFGVTDATGEYKLAHRTKAEGVEAGSYQVSISKMAMKDGSPIPEGKTAADAEAVQVVPPPYSDPSTEFVGTSVTVPASGGNFNFDIP